MKTLQDLIADKLERADARARAQLLGIPLENIQRWLSDGHSAPHRLEQWLEVIVQAQKTAEGFENLLALLRDGGEEATHLKSFDPFPGVLTTIERRQYLLECAYAH